MRTGNKFTVECFVLIHAIASKIWDVLTNPEKIKVCMAQMSLQIGASAATFYLHVIDFTRRHPFRKNLLLIAEKFLRLRMKNFWAFHFVAAWKDMQICPKTIPLCRIQLMAWKTKVLNLITEGNIPVEVEKTNQEKFMPGMMSQIKVPAER